MVGCRLGGCIWCAGDLGWRECQSIGVGRWERGAAAGCVVGSSGMRMSLGFAQSCDLIFVVGEFVCCCERKESVSGCLEALKRSLLDLGQFCRV